MKRFTCILTLLIGTLVLPSAARCEYKLRDVCRLKGQEENTLHGFGIVTGLKGTGDNSIKPTTRALARMMELVGNQIPDAAVLEELKDAKNVALVTVTADVPPAGARSGDKVDCVVNAIAAKSLAGGTLWMTPLLGPRPGSPRVYAFARGQLSIPDSASPTAAKIHRGALLAENFVNKFYEDGKMYLVIDKDHASFFNAQEIEDLINNQPDFARGRSSAEPVAHAVDQTTVEVQIPEKYMTSPVLFASLILNTKVYTAQNDSRVVIRRKEGVIIIGQNVSIGPVAITHKNLVIDAAAEGAFVPLDPSGSKETIKLKALIDSLKALQVPTADMIDIIMGLERSGDLYGKLFVE